MMKHNAGVLVYKIGKKQLKVLLCHMGGPYWKNIDQGVWSISKGEFFDEKAINAAIQEFPEETGFDIDKHNLPFLGSKKENFKRSNLFSF